ncbi:gamma-glutamyl-gamma-aminobutyrate hydrolase family protein [Aquirufa ecclesiirivi]|uniref:gamma-glutamyl-gamma-aminobutyrate hydrolase family protein n=1 Tax=Aquirufa ecclesiirivi TaxID=2715124 RepID=UPI0023D7FB13|nr:gamma-glutamyl-gamma-aminobutyrate hydrolase family protein [Aquirufa ecclesiirivi]MDF0694134.1 gamma-glutamyl-gamma-aminobutyrate hydrolase family protein [Aquirufa ecclesiirivi]
MKIRLGISFSSTNFQNYLRWFDPEVHAGKVELLELKAESSTLSDFESCDGFVLSGGCDIDTALYQGAANYPHKPEEFETERDYFEASIYQYAKKHQKPLLGICRGMQLVQVVEGGKLIQDLGDEANLIHKKSGNTDRKHSIQVHEGSLLSSISQQSSGEVNSAHHQAIDSNQLGHNLFISAWSTDTHSPEALEYQNKQDQAFMLCVQWHPERMEEKEKSPFSENIKQSFLASINHTR